MFHTQREQCHKPHFLFGLLFERKVQNRFSKNSKLVGCKIWCEKFMFWVGSPARKMRVAECVGTSTQQIFSVPKEFWIKKFYFIFAMFSVGGQTKKLHSKSRTESKNRCNSTIYWNRKLQISSLYGTETSRLRKSSDTSTALHWHPTRVSHKEIRQIRVSMRDLQARVITTTTFHKQRNACRLRKRICIPSICHNGI